MTIELHKLTKNIYIPMVFYIPYALFPGLSEDSKNKLDKVQFFNTMAILKINEKTKHLENSIYSIEILKKSSILKSNFLQLIEIKSKLTKETFYLLLGEYLNSAQAYNYAYSWMVNHIDMDIPNAPDNYKNFYIYQAEVLNNHIEEINARFNLSNDSIAPTIDFNKIFENSKGLPKLDDELKTALMQPIKTPNQTKNFKKKILLPSEDEVDNMLLEQIFNVNFSKTRQ